MIPINVHRVWLSLLSLLVIHELRLIKDSYHIKEELFLSLLTENLGIIMYFVITFLPSDSPLSKIGNNLFVLIGFLFSHIYSCVLPLIRTYFVNNQKAESLTYNKEAFERALKDKETFKLLKELAIKHFEVENIIYYEQYQKLRAAQSMEEKLSKTLHLDNAVNSKKQVQDIFKRFIFQDAPYELNLPSGIMKKAIELNNYEGIELVAKEVYSMLYLNTFRLLVHKKD
ncbi:hypothetical protein ROZALSC1DRAFT_28468 [Rozella allomycis CSF55]|uniref:RGS domain-containing protein n=1 Tax=Rozella allomycis (strain CSF55) TaxID=988480 RepID=A0A075AY49_ROZAC|nr:hypothetical protein O9G_000641 [Rozella allomycis CSF55]RKP20002.1 hypothetical protein ROZALSC1DRAFT_28468 [Rozella allomycis CSF55]|eukprot:EPZ35245.1 hypothetical protein O9G_000641 [Rozella allomycis CSF55]